MPPADENKDAQSGATGKRRHGDAHHTKRINAGAAGWIPGGHRHGPSRPMSFCLLGMLCASTLWLAGCAAPATKTNGESLVTPVTKMDSDPIDQVPIATFLTPYRVDDIAQCIGEAWARLSIIGDGKVTLHPSLKGLMVDVKASTDPLARAYVDVYETRKGTRVDYFVRSFVQDPIEDLRLRALQGCF
jgi:hypothetical protein